MRLWFGFVSTPGAAAAGWPTRHNPTNIANANPNPPTPADRVVPVHSWRLVIVPCGLILCASLVRFCLNARSRSSSCLLLLLQSLCAVRCAVQNSKLWICIIGYVSIFCRCDCSYNSAAGFMGAAQGTHGSWCGPKARQCENYLRGVRSTRRPASRDFVWVRNSRELSLFGSATPNTGRSSCRLLGDPTQPDQYR